MGTFNRHTIESSNNYYDDNKIIVDKEDSYLPLVC